MERKEFRIGNAIIRKYLDREEIDTISGYDLWHSEKLNDPIHLMEWNSLKPIPLTKEWFDKHAPCQDNDGYNYFPHPAIPNLRFYLHEDDYIQEVKFECAVMANYEHVKSVHLFQNLYWSLTGQELPLT
jgi:hypothetical protein